MPMLASIWRDPRLAEIERRKVAVVDDDHDVRDSLRFLLEVLGHAVEAFESAADFLEAEVQRFACLILDHHMPNMTGLDLAEKLRADGNLLPIMLITGSPSDTIVSRASDLGISRVLDKPPSEEELLDFIEASRSG
jgi:FixJ family two-component response regulator